MVCFPFVRRDRGEVEGDALTLSLILTFCNWNHLVTLPKPDPRLKERRREAQGGAGRPETKRAFGERKWRRKKGLRQEKGAVEAKSKSVEV